MAGGRGNAEVLTVEQREGVENRFESRRSTRHTAIVTMVAAFIGAAAGIGGVVVGAEAAGDRDDARSDREFLRQQKIAVYSEFLSKAEELEQLTDPHLPYPDTPAAPLALDPLLPEQVEPMRDLLAEMSRLETQIWMLDGDGVTYNAQEMVTAMTSALYFFEFAAECQANHDFDELCLVGLNGSTKPTDIGISEVPVARSAPPLPMNPFAWEDFSASKHLFMRDVRSDLEIVDED